MLNTFLVIELLFYKEMFKCNITSGNSHEFPAVIQRGGEIRGTSVGVLGSIPLHNAGCERVCLSTDTSHYSNSGRYIPSEF